MKWNVISQTWSVIDRNYLLTFPKLEDWRNPMRIVRMSEGRWSPRWRRNWPSSLLILILYQTCLDWSTLLGSGHFLVSCLGKSGVCLCERDHGKILLGLEQSRQWASNHLKQKPVQRSWEWRWYFGCSQPLLAESLPHEIWSETFCLPTSLLRFWRNHFFFWTQHGLVTNQFIDEKCCS